MRGPSERIGRNEAIVRQVNEAIETGRGPADVQAPVAFRCECGQLGCNQLIEVTLGDYERVRAHPRRFLVADGHEQPEVERVVRPPLGLRDRREARRSRARRGGATPR